MLKQRLFALMIVIALAISSAVPAMAGQTARQPVDPNSVQTFDNTSFTPRSLNSTPVDVVVRLTGQSVTEFETSLNRKLNDSEGKAVAASLKGNQDALKGNIQRAGGEVRDQYQYAINGIRVHIAGNKVDQLASLPDVAEVLPVQKYVIDNATSVPYIGAPAVWNASPAPNLHGEGIKVGIIDTGIDYTHANFGGPGTAAAYTAAFATSTQPADPALFGPNAPKVKGGYDLVGDAYNADNAGSVPVPDPNPLDCAGHGSHVSGTAVGFGVTAAGATYTGPYNASIYTPGAFRIGPGVAPKADLYMYRVFGCAGSTNVVVDAIDRAVKDGVDVISMSLGSDFGSARTADAVAASNAARAGVVVVASAGNAGPNPYIVGTPSTGDGVISVAANDPHASFPGATFTLSTGGAPITAINANGATFADGTVYNILTLVDNPATPVDESLGCNTTDYPASIPANTMAVVMRGVCARVHKAIIGQMVGAAAVTMVNTSTDYPPYEGAIFSDPDTGLPYTVTIPFFGVKGLASTPTSDGARLRAANGGTVTVVNAVVPNPSFSAVASFSSGGPRIGDSALKPEITAPGVSIFSTVVGTGNQGEFLSGTSMAAPHVAGVAALTKQAHPNWSARDLKAAIVDTGNPGAIAGYSTRSAGTGLVQPLSAVNTNAVASGGEHGVVALNFGFQELGHDLNQGGSVKISNHANKAVTFTVSVSNQSSVPHTLTPASGSVTVRANEDKDLNFVLKVPAATAGDSNGFYDVAGIINFTPVGGGNNGVTLHVPYYLVPRPLSVLSADSSAGKKVSATAPSTVVTVSNKKNAAIPGNADFYAWGLHSASTVGQTTNDVRDMGVQAFQNAGGPNNPLIVFGLDTYKRWSTPSSNEFDIYVDVDPQNNNGDDYVVVGVDYGAVATGLFNGQFGTFVFSLKGSGATALNPGFTFAPTDSSSASLPVLASQLCVTGQPCLSTTSPRFTYHAFSFDVFGTASEAVPGVGKFNAFSPAISTGAYLGGIVPGASASTTVSINPAEWANTPALGVLLLTTENKAGADEGLEVPLSLK